MNTARHAFTLIELLVVIAIIAILAAILFPVFAQAKAAAIHTQNISNVAQVARAAIMYANDYDDTFVSQAWVGGSPFRTYEWHELFQPYVKNWGIMYDPLRKNNCNQYKNKWGEKGVTRCMGYGVNIGIFTIGSDAGMFQNIRTYTENGEQVQLVEGRSMTFYPNPAEMTMFNTTQDEPMYTTAFDWQRFTEPNGFGRNNYNAVARNGGKWVRSFVDGHAKTVFYGRYKTSSYRHLIMPKNRRDMEQMCWSLDASGGSGRTCGQWIDYFVANRTEF